MVKNGRTTIAMLVAAAACGGALAPAALAQDESAARVWNEELLSAIRLDRPRPPVHARNLYHAAVAMYDAWAAYEEQADQVLHLERASAKDVAAARREAISYAAYRLIRNRFMGSVNAAIILPALDARMAALGYDINVTTTEGDTPAALGNRIFETIHNHGLADGSNQANNYVPNNGYMPVNEPLILAFPELLTVNDPNRWQPLAFEFFIDQNGIPVGQATPPFVCPHWKNVTPFGLTREVPDSLYFDPGPPPQLGGATDALYKEEFTEVIELSSQLTTADGVMLDIGPATHHNNTLGYNDGTGYGTNPITGQPYAPNVVPRGDYARVLAEFWADGPNSETPPGHWNVLANYVSDHPLVEKRIGGVGPIVDDLEWDVKLYLALNGATHDSAVGAWGLKGHYDSVRPITAIRYMCITGQSSDSGLPSYDPEGIPLQPGLVELIMAETIAEGQRHAHLVERDEKGFIIDDHVGDIAIRSWRGVPTDPNTVSGVGWVLGYKWPTYQLPTFVTPPFAGYTSGHSTFSRSAAEVMSEFTGSEYFPGGLGTFLAPANDFLHFELGPSVDVELQWAKYYDAADEAGISRIWGGIHPRSDDREGRIMGSAIGKIAYDVAERYYEGRFTCPGDWDGSGDVSSNDYFAFLSEFFEGNADFNRDRVTNSDDYFEFLTAFFGACD